MTFIDWSDTEGIFGLLRDFIADERNESESDPARHRFLADLLSELNDIDAQQAPPALIEALSAVSSSVNREFDNDSVMVHVRDCIEALKNAED